MSFTVSSADPPALARPPRALARLASLLPVVAFLLYALATPGLPRGDAAGVYVAAASLVEHGSFAIDGYIDALAPAPQTAGAGTSAYPGVTYAAGRYYQAVPPGRALLAAPFYALGLAFSPLLGPDAPAILVMLLGPLLGTLVVARVGRGLERAGSPRAGASAMVIVALVLLPWAGAPTVPIIAAALVAVIAPSLHPLWRGRGDLAAALIGGAGLGLLALTDYLLAIPAVLLLVLLVLRWRGGLRTTLALLAAGGIPLLLLAAWQTTTFGLPWRLAFRSAVDPAGRSLLQLVQLPLVVALILAALVFALVSMPAKGAAWPRRRDLAWLVPAAIVVTIAGTWSSIEARPAVVLPVRWWEPVALVPLLVLAMLLAIMLGWQGRWVAPGRLWTAALLLLSCLLAVPLPLFLAPLVGGRAAAARAATELATSYVAPFAIGSGGNVLPVWTTERGQVQMDTDALHLEAGARATSPWIDIWPGSTYELSAGGNGQVSVTYGWEDVARNIIATQTATFPASAARRARFAAPPGAAGLRLHVEATNGAATVLGLQLILADGVRVEPFPDGQRAALAFSFDWESAMGGLIHSRSGEANAEGEGAAVGVGADGAPSVKDAEDKGLRMRDGAQFLADLFARYGIRATFYATGYDLLPGNPTCEKFLGDPIYRNADAAHGWGSDWWRTHPWYGDDPCATEAQAPAWYFASETRALVAAGHEIASHSFGHLYVRGVTPEQLSADLEEWNHAATALGLPAARSFAFPWTSSNSLDDRFWSVFARLGMTVLTRLYQTPQQPLPHPYELDRIKGNPDLIAFPDFYLASKADAQEEALARIDITLAVRGYHSLWDHPNEALEQGGQVIWSRVVDYAAAQRERGLWIAPVTEIADYGTATRDLAVTALPVAGGTRLTVENRSGRALDGVTLHLPTAARAVTIDGRAAPPGDQVILPSLPAGARAIVVVRR